MNRSADFQSAALKEATRLRTASRRSIGIGSWSLEEPPRIRIFGGLARTGQGDDGGDVEAVHNALRDSLALHGLGFSMKIRRYLPRSHRTPLGFPTATASPEPTSARHSLAPLSRDGLECRWGEGAPEPLSERSFVRSQSRVRSPPRSPSHRNERRCRVVRVPARTRVDSARRSPRPVPTSGLHSHKGLPPSRVAGGPESDSSPTTARPGLPRSCVQLTARPGAAQCSSHTGSESRDPSAPVCAPRQRRSFTPPSAPS